jgi:hypothetical protein
LHIIQRRDTEIIFSLYLVFEEKTRIVLSIKTSIANAFSNISKEYVRSCHFPSHIHNPFKWVLNFDMLSHFGLKKIAYLGLAKKTKIAS